MTEETTAIVEAEVVDEVNDIYDVNGIVLYDSYEQFVERAKGRLTQEVQGVVWTRWTLGAHVKAVLEDARYGSHKINDLESDLDINKKTLYACKTLFETYSRQDMEEKVIPKQLSFRALNYIARVPDEAKRDSYMDQVADGSIKAEDIPKLEAGTGVVDVTGEGGEGEGGETMSGVSGEPQSDEQKASASIRRAIGAIDGPLDLIITHIAAAEKSLTDLDLVVADDALYERVTDDLAELRAKLSDIQTPVATLIKRLDEVV